MSLIKNHIKNGIIGKSLLVAFISVFAWMTCLPEVNGQGRQNPITVDGVVRSAQNLPVMGATVYLQESTTFTTTDEFGNFTLEVPGANSVINIEAEGFEPLSVTIIDDKFLDLTLDFSVAGQGISDRVFVAWGVSDRRSNVGSISAISHDELRKSPVMNLATAVSGRLSGFTVVQGSGTPGLEDVEWRIRGIRTLEDGGMNNMAKGGVGAPTIIVDGFERDFTDFDASEIESISVLKDASATALYGLRGANGVILVNTRRGQANRRTIDVEVSNGIVVPTRLPNFLDAYDYATLFNEARLNDGLDAPGSPFYSETDLQKFRSGSDPLTHPDVDFYDEFLKKYTHQRKAALTLSGGNNIVRYFVSFAYNNQGGLYDRTDEGTLFTTKTNYTRYNTRVNLDIAVTKRFSAAFNLAGRIEDRRYPYDSEGNIFNDLSNTPPTAYPLSFTGIDPALNKEIFMLGGNSTYTTNPLGRLSYRGFREDTRRYYQIGTKLSYDLGDITEGLKLNFEFNADGYNYFRVSQYMNYQVWDRVVQPDNSIAYVSFNTPSSLSRSYGTDTYTSTGSNLYLTWDRTYGDNGFKVIALWRRWTTVFPQANQPDQKLEDYAIRANYSYKNRYFLEGNFALSGSENFFMTNTPRIPLPAFAAGWIISEEDFISESDFLQFLKLKASWGITANHDYTFPDPNGIKYRYAYRNRWWSQNSQQAFGAALAYVSPIVREGVVPNPDITAEKAMMTNIGIEAGMLDNRLSFTTEVWHEKRYDIFTRGVGSIPLAFGALSSNLPIENEGIVLSKGIETTLGWRDNASSSFGYWVNGMVDFWTNKIDYMAEPYKEDPYRVETGGLVRQNYGLIALGLFKNQDEIDNSPEQLFGPYQPGDIKYKDMNDDGVIDANDYSAVGRSTFPQLSYSLDMGIRAGNFDFSVLLQGSSMKSYYLNNNVIRAFTSNGKISDFALNRYTDEASWATADYPRLTTVANDNNWRISTFWLRDAAFLRVRNLEIGYNLPMEAARKMGMYGMRIYLNAYNLLSLDNFKTFDPEDPNAGISKYPMTSIVNLGVNLKF
ncbi:MAG: TonB-dependent receptor [Bacteroidales bacterium]